MEVGVGLEVEVAAFDLDQQADELGTGQGEVADAGVLGVADADPAGQPRHLDTCLIVYTPAARALAPLHSHVYVSRHCSMTVRELSSHRALWPTFEIYA
jgi:hypothetical protein